jgi:hypothetical protein
MEEVRKVVAKNMQLNLFFIFSEPKIWNFIFAGGKYFKVIIFGNLCPSS